MIQEILHSKGLNYLKKLCVQLPGRSVGSKNNLAATEFFRKEISSLGWDTEASEFKAMDWEETGVILKSGAAEFEAFASPYSLGCSVEAPLITVSSIEELTQSDLQGKILLLRGEIAKEQIMPKNFVFYNPKGHQKIVSLLEIKQPAAIITATERNSALAGGLYPFPMFEDGDFNIPSVYMTKEEGERLTKHDKNMVLLQSSAHRISSKGYNIIARKGKQRDQRIVITAHIDAKKSTPGAIDNATGVTVLLLLAHVLKDYHGERMIEIVAFNGEDYFAVPGQMQYISQNQGRFNEILLNINIDGAGHKDGETAFSFFNVPQNILAIIKNTMTNHQGITEGPQWPQGDHSIFVQYGCPAMAVSSKWFLDHMEIQDVTHTQKDNIDIVDHEKLVEIAEALGSILQNLG